MSTTLAQDAAALDDLKVRAAEAKAHADALKQEADKAEAELFERMDAEGVSGIKVDGTNFVPVETVYGQIQDRSAFIDWAEENQPELLERKERKALLNEVVREKLDNGETLPPGLGFYARNYISRRAA